MNELTPHQNRALTATEFDGLADVPPELEWFGNIQNPNTRRAYRRDIHEFTSFASLEPSRASPGDPGACDRLAQAAGGP